ncbi:MAG: hypothetical protein ABFD98_19400 [Syntrophobacteraceae bacterium]|nr:hypothetical protein [Desulfobacteraceae bacterium]
MDRFTGLRYEAAGPGVFGVALKQTATRPLPTPVPGTVVDTGRSRQTLFRQLRARSSGIGRRSCISL